VKPATIDEIALGATRAIDVVIAAHPDAGPAEWEDLVRETLALWIGHAVKREVINDRRRVARQRRRAKRKARA
jgi:hypothetical protein